MRALLVDDSITIKKIQRNILKEIDISSEWASDGKEAMEILTSDQNFDIILLDINMPNMNGIETVKEIRANDHLKAIPVLMCSSVTEKEKVTQAIHNGANNYVIKPFDVFELKSKVERLIDRETAVSSS